MQNIYLDFKVDKLVLTSSEKYQVPAGNRNYIWINFTLSEDWQLPITVLFQRSGVTRPEVILEPSAESKASCMVPFGFLTQPGSFTVSVEGGDRKITSGVNVQVTNSADLVQPAPPQPDPEPSTAYVLTIDEKMPLLREVGGVPQYYSETLGIWRDFGTGGTVEAYRRAFSQEDWQPYLTDFQITITSLQHQKGGNASVLEVLRSQAEYLEGVIYDHRRLTNGNIVLVSNQRFSGQITII